MAKGFGTPQSIPTRDATKFMVAFAKCYFQSKGDQDTVREFLASNLTKLDESLLEALPMIFYKLLKNPIFNSKENISAFFIAFGSSIYIFPLGSRKLNLEISITACQVALRSLQRNQFPSEWAAGQTILANGYSDRIQGDRADNIEKAIAAYELALQVHTSDLFPTEWAEIQNNLGLTYSDRIRENRADNIEKAIAAHKLALQVYIRDVFPTEWASAQNGLGNAYLNRIRGDRADNIEKAIAAHELALQVYVHDISQEKWASAQNGLGNTYIDRIRGDRSENIEKAILAYQLALKVHTRDEFPTQWAGIQNNLALAYSDRTLGDRQENIEQTIKAYELSLQIYKSKSFPEHWARVQHNIANTYRDRVQGELTSNLDTAIEIYQQVEQVFTREALPYQWARNQGDWAEALIKQAALTDRNRSLDTAVDMLKGALEVAVPGSPDFIDSQYRLGTALSRRFEQNQDPQDLQQALKAYKTALDAISPEHYDRAKIWQALPTTQSVLGSRLVREGEWQEGLQLLLNSVRLLREGDDPLAHANALYQTARAHETLSDWDNSRLYYRDALRLYDHLKDESGIAKSRHGLGSVLVSQGYLAKGMGELQKALNLYQQIHRPDKVAEVESLLQTVQQAEQHMQKVAV
ncbi:MAG: tetratricopeptide repeat protein [Leptolyngbyaceae cyanobacterium]